MFFLQMHTSHTHVMHKSVEDIAIPTGETEYVQE